ncbi:Transcription termination/antitermination protein NusG [Chlamydiales bacterium SCGC AG-110-P3]|nr:Transcription termination/antitermination protein NusG [Chlamydiales bacterium SCGC AG-110-P3]
MLMQTTWYVLQVLSGQEKKVKKTLEENREVRGMSDLIQEILLPVENVSEVKKGEKRIVEKKLWPGYLLARMTLTDDAWNYVKNTNGVIDFLGGGTATPLTEDEVASILRDLEKKKDTVTQKHRLQIGDRVKIVDGVFVNFIGSVIEVFNEKGVVSVMVSIFGRDTRVDDLESWQVEAITEEEEAEA